MSMHFTHADLQLTRRIGFADLHSDLPLGLLKRRFDGHEGTLASEWLPRLRAGALFTPRGGILEGITRETVFEIADELGVPAAERDLTPYDLYTADEAFLCSTAGGLFPVVEVDGRTVGCGTLGSTTQRVRERYWQRHLSGPDVTPVLA